VPNLFFLAALRAYVLLTISVDLPIDIHVLSSALEHILNELMANGQGHQTDPPAPENVIDDLTRVVLEDNREQIAILSPFTLLAC